MSGKQYWAIVNTIVFVGLMLSLNVKDSYKVWTFGFLWWASIGLFIVACFKERNGE